MKKVLKIALDVVIWIFFAFSVCVTVIAISAQNNSMGVPQVFGKIPVTILSDSMKDTFKKGDLIIANALTGEEKASLQVDDVITFATDLNDDGIQDINTHRIVAVQEQNGYTFYTTRGDNAETNKKDDDKLVRYDMVIGKYEGQKISGAGSVLSFLQTSKGFLICVVLPLILFFLYELYRFIVIIVASKGKKALTAEQEEEIRKRAVEEYLKEQNEQRETADSKKEE